MTTATQRGEYVRPATVEDAIAALAEVEGARVIAGGTDLMVALRDGRIRPARLVDIGAIRELAEIGDEGGGLSIGAAARVSDVLAYPGLDRRFPVLVDAGRLLGGWQIQNMATIGGNLCNASPAAEMSGPLLVLEAAVDVAGPSGTRRIPLESFWEGPGRSVLAPGELVTRILIPGHVRGEQSAYLRADIRHSVDIALVSASARLELDGDRVRLARLALGAVAPVTFRVQDAERLMEGAAVTDAALSEVRHLASAAARPITDVRASADYRLAMAGVLAARAVQLAMGREAS